MAGSKGVAINNHGLAMGSILQRGWVSLTSVSYQELPCLVFFYLSYYVIFKKFWTKNISGGDLETGPFREKIT